MSADRLEPLAVLVHEVRSPVAALAALARAFRGASPAERRSLVRLAMASSEAIERLVADAAVSSIRPVEVDLAGLAADAAQAARLNGAEVRVVGSGVMVRVDPVRLRQALDNLLVNAARHAPGSPVVITVGRDGEVVTLTVRDAGQGIAPDQQQRIFQAGETAGSAPGSGLGLAIARAIAVAHGGTLTVSSSPGGGAAFTLAVPVGS